MSMRCQSHWWEFVIICAVPGAVQAGFGKLAGIATAVVCGLLLYKLQEG